MTERPLSRDPEDLWEQLLSRQATQIQAAFASLAPDEQTAVLAHLYRMAEEESWHLEQHLSARAALQVLSKSLPSNHKTGHDQLTS
jgi:rubrerythrin